MIIYLCIIVGKQKNFFSSFCCINTHTCFAIQMVRPCCFPIVIYNTNKVESQLVFSHWALMKNIKLKTKQHNIHGLFIKGRVLQGKYAIDCFLIGQSDMTVAFL